MADPQPIDGDPRFVDGRWERYDESQHAWIPIEPPDDDVGGAGQGAGGQVLGNRQTSSRSAAMKLWRIAARLTRRQSGDV